METLPLIAQTHRYIAFRTNKELFGVHIEVVHQIIPVAPTTEIPRTPQYFLGILNLRGDTIPIIDLRLLFGQSRLEPHPDQRIIIVDFENSCLGVLVDSVEEVINVPLGEVRSPPPLLDPKMVEYLIGAYQMPNQQSLLLLDQELLIRPQEFRCGDFEIEQDPILEKIGDNSPPEKQETLLGFELGHVQYALSIEVVEEIIQSPIVTQIPQTSENIEGIFNLRDEMIPLVRLDRRLGFLVEDTSEVTTVLIVNVAGVKLGIIVGKIQEVRHLPQSCIEPIPPNAMREETKYLRGIIQNRVNQKLTLQSVIILESLFSAEELERLSDFVQKELLAENIKVEKKNLLLLKFKIAGEPYAIRLNQIDQIIDLCPIFPVPQAPPYVLGLINVRGEIMTVLDTPRLLKSQFDLNEALAKIIIVEVKNQKIGCLVDEVTSTLTVSETIFDSPENWSHKEKQPLVEALGYEKEGHMTVLLDVVAAYHHATQVSTASPTFRTTDNL